MLDKWRELKCSVPLTVPINDTRPDKLEPANGPANISLANKFERCEAAVDSLGKIW